MKLTYPQGEKLNRYLLWARLPDDCQLSSGAVWNKEENDELKYHGKPCIYTDARYDVDISYPATLWVRMKSVKTAVRKLNQLIGTKKGMKIAIQSNYVGVEDITYTCTEDKPLPAFNVDHQELLKPYDELTDLLRGAGWHVFAKEDCAVAYGNGKICIWSKDASYTDVRWDKLGEFDKWSRMEKAKGETAEDIFDSLKSA